MLLVELMGGKGATDQVEIRGLTMDSRKVEPGFLFAAFKGEKTDGRDYIKDAIQKGAAAILTDSKSMVDVAGAVHVVDDNPRLRLAKMAARFYGKAPQTLVAVTGTNGKTSVASFARQIWQALGHSSASIGTMGVESEAFSEYTGLTTPDAVTFQKSLAQLAEKSVTHTVFEASSHGLSQNRMDGADISVAAFTNLTRDHLDYHRTFENYLYTKARLFGDLLPPSGTAVINIDGAYGREVENLCWGRGQHLITVGQKDAAIGIKSITPDDMSQRIVIGYEGRDTEVLLPLAGRFQAENAVLAAAIAIATGATPQDAFMAIEGLKGVAGRFEVIGKTNAGGQVVVDYAHTPDGLETVLKTARDHALGKLHVVFGCGGDRDAGKRPMMGKLASHFADHVYVTDDNPRTEDAKAIRGEILAATPGGIEIADRAEAILTALQVLQQNDVLVVSGKGHEEGQIVGDKVLPFSDIEVVEAALRANKGEVLNDA